LLKAIMQRERAGENEDVDESPVRLSADEHEPAVFS